METVSDGIRGLRVLLRLNMDWLCFSAVLLIALYASAYLIWHFALPV
jgi:hypothetical protein